MLKKISVSLLLVVLTYPSISAQHLLGGQLRTDYVSGASPPTVSAILEIYRTVDSSPKQEITFSWGDGTTEELELIGTGIAGEEGIAIDYYRGYHLYDTTGYMIYEYRDSFLVEDVLNIPNSGEQYLYLTDTVLVGDSISAPIINHGIWYNEGLIPTGSVESFIFLETGRIIQTFGFYSITQGAPAASVSSMHPYPLPGATLPAATDCIVFINNGFFIWERPVAPGRYGISFRNREFSFTNNPIYNELIAEDGLLLTNTLTRQVILTITEEMIVNTAEPAINIDFQLFPNPATASCQISYPGFTGEVQLRVTNLQGQQVHQELLPAGNLGTSLNLNNWPAGVYFVELSSALGRVVRKLVVD